MARSKILHIEDAEIFFTNFRGLARGKIPAGVKSFCVYVPEDMVDQLLADDWSLFEDTYHLEDGMPPRHYIRVRVRFDKFPPKIRLKSNNKMVDLNEETVGRLDTDDIKYVELDVNGSLKNGQDYKPGDGRTVYLSQMFVEIKPDWFEEKYGMPQEMEDMDDNVPF